MKKSNFITFLLLAAFITFCLPTTSFAAGQITGSEVLVIGDSFLAMSHDITKRLEQNAKNDGVLASTDKFRDLSVSGTMLSGGISPNIPQQYQNGVNAGPVKYVIMDGGGNDCIGGSVSNAVTAARNLFQQMGKSGTVKVFYLFYPDAVGGMAGMLNPNLNTLRPQIQSIVTSSTTPKGYFLDLRPTFEGKYSSYILSDGIHPTMEGSYAAADAIWAEMKKVGFFGSTTPTPKVGDCNNDGNIDAIDFSLLKQYLMNPGSTYNSLMDLNADNTINALDFAIMKKYLLGMVNTLPNN
ncbi:dockerin type I domain-containing protein [Ruminiclostridium cellulolyticum]|uniref:cellulase n=1 Tax=Ruminiclostridium cellulolyticum (strain ATCC 35319 / DSM 5812 / JCM 6584 / H10) TaxID=394503 RepID=B8I9G0_RUMCH|nr:dockerin type I domain-containing protein [Ruminiclostridium cellulolyticum]ACL75420.1 cellulosome protein dockerin type I [Ruminiclostridium cellulolyticum H10]